MSGNFPTVPVDDLLIHPRENDLVVGTHGRSIYILDDVTALEAIRTSLEELNSKLEPLGPMRITP